MTTYTDLDRLYAYTQDGLQLEGLDTYNIIFKDGLYHTKRPACNLGAATPTLNMSFAEVYQNRDKLCEACSEKLLFGVARLSVWVRKAELAKEIINFRVKDEDTVSDYLEMVSTTRRYQAGFEDLPQIQAWIENSSLITDPTPISNLNLLRLSEEFFRKLSRDALTQGGSNALGEPRLKIESETELEALLDWYAKTDSWVLVYTSQELRKHGPEYWLEREIESFHNIIKIHPNFYLIPSVGTPWVRDNFYKNRVYLLKGEVLPEHIEAFKVLFSEDSELYSDPLAVFQTARALSD